MADDRKYWFPAKRYGWGWGPPVAWQGWVALWVFIGLLLGGIPLFPPKEQLASFVAWSFVLTLAFFALCWWKGEPPKWRWGEKER